MKRERFDAIRPGDVIICRSSNFTNLTKGNRYEVKGRSESNGRLRIVNDQGYIINVGLGAFAAGDIHLFSHEWYRMLQAGDRVMFRGYAGNEVEFPDYLTVGKVYELLQREGRDNFYVLDDNGEWEQIVSTDMLLGSWFKVGSSEESVILPEDYASMIDLALETRDKEWYNELMKKAKEPV